MATGRKKHHGHPKHHPFTSVMRKIITHPNGQKTVDKKRSLMGRCEGWTYHFTKGWRKN